MLVVIVDEGVVNVTTRTKTFLPLEKTHNVQSMGFLSKMVQSKTCNVKFVLIVRCHV